MPYINPEGIPHPFQGEAVKKDSINRLAAELQGGDTPPKDIPTVGAAGGRPKVSEVTLKAPAAITPSLF